MQLLVALDRYPEALALLSADSDKLTRAYCLYKTGREGEAQQTIGELDDEESEDRAAKLLEAQVVSPSCRASTSLADALESQSYRLEDYKTSRDLFEDLAAAVDDVSQPSSTSRRCTSDASPPTGPPRASRHRHQHRRLQRPRRIPLLGPFPPRFNLGACRRAAGDGSRRPSHPLQSSLQGLSLHRRFHFSLSRSQGRVGVDRLGPSQASEQAPEELRSSKGAGSLPLDADARATWYGGEDCGSEGEGAR